MEDEEEEEEEEKDLHLVWSLKDKICEEICGCGGLVKVKSSRMADMAQRVKGEGV